ncbi:MAG: GGDEF domain-containing protein [Blastocatellia bacterium]
MSVSFSETLEQERARLLRAANDCFDPAANSENGLEELLAAAVTLRQTVDDVLKQRAENISKVDLIRLQSELHSALDEKLSRVVKEHCERRFRQLTERAMHDSLTGLMNRAALEKRLNEEVARALRYGRDLTLVMFDVDGFKSVNDRFGHQIGDQVLMLVAKVLQSSFRQSDAVFRYGGDEFVALCPETSGAVIEKALRRIENQLMIFSSEAGLVPDMGISLGIASLPADAVNADELIRLADQRLYLCKRKHHQQTVARQWL